MFCKCFSDGTYICATPTSTWSSTSSTSSSRPHSSPPPPGACDISKMLLRCTNVEQICRALPQPESLDDRVRDTTMSCCCRSTYSETVASVDLMIKSSFVKALRTVCTKCSLVKLLLIIKLKKRTVFVTLYCKVGKHSHDWTKCVSCATHIYTNALPVRIRFGQMDFLCCQWQKVRWAPASKDVYLKIYFPVDHHTIWHIIPVDLH